jgi:hypothetical protein
MAGRHDATGEGVSGMHRMGDDGDVARRTAPGRALRRSTGTLLLAGAIGFGVLTVLGVAGTAGGPAGVITTLAAASSPQPSSHPSPTAPPSATPTPVPAPLAPPCPPGLGSILFGCPTPYPTPVPTPTPAPTPTPTPTPASTPTPTATPTGGSTPTPRPATPAPGGGIVSGPYCDPTVATCPGQQQPATPASSSLFVPGPVTASTGTDTSSAGTGAATDTSGSSSTDTSNVGAGASTGTSGTSSTDTTGTDAQVPDTGGTPIAGAGGASSGGGTNGNSLFGNQPLPAADTSSPATETTVNTWAIAGAALIVLAVVLSHVVSTVRRRGRKRAASAA